jgi:hypothetical protein
VTITPHGLSAATVAATANLPAPIVPIEVKTLSGQTISVLGDGERVFYEGQAKRYFSENKFTNTSDLLDLDRLVFLELLIYRATSWLGSGVNYDGMQLSDAREADCRKALKENSAIISTIKNDLGMTKTQREKSQFSDVGTYITQLKMRAKEFGVHREKQLATGITLCQQLFAIIGAFDRSDEAEKTKIGFETEVDIVDWIRTIMRPEFDKVDAYFVQNQQRYWSDL